MAKIEGDSLVDKRIVERNIRKGLLTKERFEKILEDLPDVADKGISVPLENYYVNDNEKTRR